MRVEEQAMTPLQKINKNRRYQPQILVKHVGKKGQERLDQTGIIVVGMGALGSILSELALRSGITHQILIDDDIVHEENLHRQILYDSNDIGNLKVAAAKKKLLAINRNATIQVIPHRIEKETCLQFLKPAIATLAMPTEEKSIKAQKHQKKHTTKHPIKWVVAECSDTLATKVLVNDVCIQHNIPLILGTAVGTQGYAFQISKSIGCLREVFPIQNHSALLTQDHCATQGILPTTASMIATLLLQLLYEYRITGREKKEVYYCNTWNLQLLQLNRKHPCMHHLQKQLVTKDLPSTVETPTTGKKKSQQKKTTNQDPMHSIDSIQELCGGKRYLAKGTWQLATFKKKLPHAQRIEDVLLYQGIVIAQNKMLIPATTKAEAKKKLLSLLSLAQP